MSEFRIVGSGRPQWFMVRGGDVPAVPFSVVGPKGVRYTVAKTQERTPNDHPDRDDRLFMFTIAESGPEPPAKGTLTVDPDDGVRG
ncbi:MAG TPA: hypothetical protein VH062_24780 [Polyangiaceae bacterium]|jgi:hypothetical protein|nr:hypothetical protein [Polyangiaceae bacterium]